MHSLTNKAEIARRNGARSKGPITAAGKARSCRNSLIHGRRATKLADFTPPNSATLTNEDRQKFFTLFDQNLAKFRPADPAEKALVRDLTNRQWDNLRLESARQAILNRELALHGDPTVALEFAYTNRAFTAMHRELAANTRLIAQIERRLKLLKQAFPAPTPAPMDSENERTQEPTAQPVETKEETDNAPTKRIYYRGFLTPDVIKKYRRLYPNCDLSFIDEPENSAM
jgi:hypothetical protein